MTQGKIIHLENTGNFISTGTWPPWYGLAALEFARLLTVRDIKNIALKAMFINYQFWLWFESQGFSKINKTHMKQKIITF